MKRNSFILSYLTIETVLYLLAFTLALIVRLFQLGAAPLTDFEAGWALQAWDLVQGNHPVIGPQPAYVILTAGLFFLFPVTNALARLLPALAGSLLVFVPWLLRSSTGSSRRLRLAGLLLAFFLALDPGLIALSRTSGSPMMALSFSLLTFGLLVDRRARLAGILAALVLLSGTALLEGLLGAGLAWLAAWVLDLANWLNPSKAVIGRAIAHQPRAWRHTIYFLLGTGLIIGTGILFVPQGLGAFASTLPAYLKGWITPSNIPALRILAAPLYYQPLAVLFGLTGALIAWIKLRSRQPEDFISRLFTLWVLLALFTALVYPAHQVASAAWALIPLWSLASVTLAGLILKREEGFSLTAALGHAGLTVLFLVLIGHNLLRLNSLNASPILYLAVVGGVVLMCLIVAVLVAAGWTMKTALCGLAWGSAAVLLTLMISFSWKAAVLYPNGANELWSTAPAAGQLDELVETVTDLSWWNKGQPDALDLVITLNAPSLRWALRSFKNTQYKSLVVPPEAPSVIITSGERTSLSLPASYRGQKLILSETSAWNGALPENILRWIAFRQAPRAQETLILWVRNDLIPDGAALQSEVSAP